MKQNKQPPPPKKINNEDTTISASLSQYFTVVINSFINLNHYHVRYMQKSVVQCKHKKYVFTNSYCSQNISPLPLPSD